MMSKGIQYCSPFRQEDPIYYSLPSVFFLSRLLLQMILLLAYKYEVLYQKGQGHFHSQSAKKFFLQYYSSEADLRQKIFNFDFFSNIAMTHVFHKNYDGFVFKKFL